MSPWQERFPALFARVPFSWGGMTAGGIQVQFSLDHPPEKLVSNVRIIGRAEGGIVVCANDNGWHFLPGGTREPGESIGQAASRELLEKSGAVFTGPLTWLGSFRVEDPGSKPHRPHLPFPVSHWLYVVADVAVHGVPTNPADGENVTEVLTLPPDEAIAYLALFDDTGMTDVLRLALAMNQLGAPGGVDDPTTRCPARRPRPAPGETGTR
jgi:8-oxo-dGTP diphosphatase